MSSPSAVITNRNKTVLLIHKIFTVALIPLEALSIEHPGLKFTYFLPNTFEGEFRAGVVDGGPVRDSKYPNNFGVKKEDVAKRGILAVDRAEKNVFVPWNVGIAHFVYWIRRPSVVEKITSKTYSFEG